MKPTEGQSADELAAEIAQTRQELGETIDALAHKVDVKARITEVGKDVAAEARGTAEELAEFAGRTAERVRRNPLPLIALMAGVALAVWLIVKGRRS